MKREEPYKILKKIIKINMYFILSFSAIIIWMVFIFGMSAKTGEESAGLSYKLASTLYKIPTISSILKFNLFHLLLRKLAHCTEYGILELLILNFVHACRRKFNRTVYIATMFFCCLYAALDEYHQSFVNGRGSNVIDVCIDTIGAICFLSIVMLIRKNILKMQQGEICDEYAIKDSRARVIHKKEI